MTEGEVGAEGSAEGWLSDVDSSLPQLCVASDQMMLNSDTEKGQK